MESIIRVTVNDLYYRVKTRVRGQALMVPDHFRNDVLNFIPKVVWDRETSEFSLYL